MNEVYINKISKYLPYEPVSNDDMEGALGMVDGIPSKARRIVLRNNGIKTRYYCFSPGQKTLSNAEMTAKAVELLLNENEDNLPLELLSCGTTSPDQTLPSHAAMVHGLLGLPALEIASFSGACNTGMNALKYAFLSVMTGQHANAVATGSERISKYLTADKFQKEIDRVKEIEENGFIAFEKDFLRWMLSDGAGAAFLENKPNKEGISLKIEWMEMTSFAGEIETCMYSGGIKEGRDLIGYNDLKPSDWLSQSVFALKQDTKLLGEFIVQKGVDFLEVVMEKRKFNPENIDWFLPHLSSEFFRGKILEELENRNISIPAEKWFTNLSEKGNVGAASPYLMLEELMNHNRFKKREKVFMMIPESARFSYTFLLMTIV